MVEAKQVFTHIHEAIKRKKATWGIGIDKTTHQIFLAIGAPSVMKVVGGAIIAVSLSTEELLKLKDVITELLKEKTS